MIGVTTTPQNDELNHPQYEVYTYGHILLSIALAGLPRPATSSRLELSNAQRCEGGETYQPSIG